MSAPDRDQAQVRPGDTRRRSLLVVLPVLVFAALAAIFYTRLFSGDPSRLPSALIDKPVPAFQLAPLAGLTRDGAPVPGFADADLRRGAVSLVNVWASWCGPCRQEHPVLMDLASAGDIRIYGLNYKDKTENARRFLGQLGSPFHAVGVDETGRVAIDWGVYGVPETFIVDGTGRIVDKFVGPLTPAAVETVLKPAIIRARSAK